MSYGKNPDGKATKEISASRGGENENPNRK